MKAFVSISLVCLTTAAFSEPPDMLWTRAYGLPGYQALYDMQVTRDGGFIMVGVSDNNTFLLRAAANGDTLWTRTYDLAPSDWANSVRELHDGNFVIVGYMGCGFIMRTDSLGDTVWTRPVDEAFELYTVSLTHNEEFVVCGLSADQMDMVVARFGAWSMLQWSCDCGGFYHDCGFDVREQADGSIMAVG
jgi:hypothetical protein